MNRRSLILEDGHDVRSSRYRNVSAILEAVNHEILGQMAVLRRQQFRDLFAQFIVGQIHLVVGANQVTRSIPIVEIVSVGVEPTSSD